MKMSLQLRLSRLVRLSGAFCLIGAGWTTIAGFASAQVTTGISVSPNPLPSVTRFSATQEYLGDAGVLTVTIVANSTLAPGADLRLEECGLDPTSLAQCDGSTGQTTDVGGTSPIVPAANGSVTFTMYVWELPTGYTPDDYDMSDTYTYNQPGFDPGTSIVCDDAVTDGNLNGDSGPGTAHPCSIWVGDDPADFTQNSFVFNGIQPEAAPLGATPPATTTTTAGSTTSSTAGSTTTTGPTTSTTHPSTTTSSSSTTSTTAGSTTTSTSTTTTEPTSTTTGGSTTTTMAGATTLPATTLPPPTTTTTRPGHFRCRYRTHRCFGKGHSGPHTPPPTQPHTPPTQPHAPPNYPHTQPTFPHTKGKGFGPKPRCCGAHYTAPPPTKGSSAATASALAPIDPTSSDPQTATASSSSSLAYTGSSPYVVWLAIFGVGMIFAGEFGRRRAKARRVSLRGLGPDEDS